MDALSTSRRAWGTAPMQLLATNLFMGEEGLWLHDRILVQEQAKFLLSLHCPLGF